VEEWNATLVLTSVGTGFVFGYVIQRGGFCLTRALTNFFIMGDRGMVQSYLIALVSAAAGTHLLIELGLVEIPIRPFRWLSNLVGGFVFGIGMILSGGCAGSTWYRVGEGAIGALVVLSSFALGATATSVGLLAPLRQTLQAPEIVLDGTAPTLPSLLGLSPWWVVLGLGLLIAFVVWSGRNELRQSKSPVVLTGMTVGLLIALGWWTSSFGDLTTGITFAINTGHWLTYPLVRYPSRISWSMWLLPGVVSGAFVSAWRSGDFGWKPLKRESLPRLVSGGLVMGVGAILAEGCNITQGLTNGATLALGSLTAFGAMIGGGWVAAWVLFLRK
jgi:uncharacterized membrane protein YedE/YeeE